MWFVARPYGSNAPPIGEYPHVQISQDNWDDYGFKSTFEAVLYLAPRNQILLGTLKIIRADQESGFTPIPNRPFEQLGPDYASLGSDIAYYEKALSLGKEFYEPILLGLADIAYDDIRRAKFEDNAGYRVSLLRFSGAEKTIQEAASLFKPTTGPVRPTSAGFKFLFSTRLGRGARGLLADFDFKRHGNLPNRMNVVIGYNGTGKTRLLSNLATVASGYGYSSREELLEKQAGRFVGEPSPFKNVMVISYSAFDAFAIPGQNEDERERLKEDRAYFRYIYCGLRELIDDEQAVEDEWPEDSDELPYRLKLSSEIQNEFREALRVIRGQDRMSEFREIMQPLLQDASFQKTGLSSLYSDQTNRSPLSIFRRLSSGHKIVLKIVAELTAYLGEKQPTLVLIDEPETHLHPPLLASLLRCIRDCLERYNAFAIVATHSPVVLQETPSRYVQVLRRTHDRSSLDRQSVETFGESIGVITQDVFNLDDSATDWHQTLEELARDCSLDEVTELFDNRLGFSARSYFMSISKRSA